MKRLILIVAVIAGLATASLPNESQAACGRFGSGLRAAVRAPFRAVRALRFRRGHTYSVATGLWHSVCTNCQH